MLSLDIKDWTGKEDDRGIHEAREGRLIRGLKIRSIVRECRPV